MSQQKRHEAIDAAKQRVREAFAAFESKPGTIAAADLGALVRALGANVTQATVKQLEEVRGGLIRQALGMQGQAALRAPLFAACCFVLTLHPASPLFAAPAGGR